MLSNLHSKQGIVTSFNIQKKLDDDPVSVFLKRASNDIYFYFKCIGFDPTWQQKELIEAFVEGRPEIATVSGKGPGKTAVSSALLPWWSLVTPMSLSVVTAPTESQCKRVWLSEARKWIGNSQFKGLKRFFHFTGTGYSMCDPRSNKWYKEDEWGCYIRTATRPENFQGIHNDDLLIYCEEASGIDRGIMQAIQDTLSGNKGTPVIGADGEEYTGNARNRWVAVGNGNSRSCRFFDFFNHLRGNPWYCIQWNAEETPISGWFSGQRNKDIAEEFGVDSDVYRVAVKGEFPSEDPDCLMTDEELRNCYGPEAYARATAIQEFDKQIGMDLASMGGDANVAIHRQGRVVLNKKSFTGVSSNDLIDYALLKTQDYLWTVKECIYVVDKTGMGEGATDRLGSAKRLGNRVHNYESHANAREYNKYADMQSEAYFHFRRLVRSGELYLGEKPDHKMISQFVNRKYWVEDTRGGVLKVEPKKDYKKRMSDADLGGELGKSPDDADAMVMAFYPHASVSQRYIG